MSTLLAAAAPRTPRPDVAAASLLAGSALLSLVLVLHHPVLPSGPRAGRGGAGVAAGIVALGPALRAVHGALLALLAAQALGFHRFSARLGWGRLPVAAGFLAYAAGVALLAVPALLDGFVTPAFAAACLRAAARAAEEAMPGAPLGAVQSCAPGDGGALRLIAVVIQVFTKAGLVAVAVATAAWALALLSRPGGTGGPAGPPDVFARGAGALGLVCAAAPVAALLGATTWLRPGSLAALVTAQVVWNLLAAAVLVRGAPGVPAA